MNEDDKTAKNELMNIKIVTPRHLKWQENHRMNKWMTGGDNKSNNKTRQSEENEWRLNELTNYGRTCWKRQGNVEPYVEWWTWRWRIHGETRCWSGGKIKTKLALSTKEC